MMNTSLILHQVVHGQLIRPAHIQRGQKGKCLPPRSSKEPIHENDDRSDHQIGRLVVKINALKRGLILDFTVLLSYLLIEDVLLCRVILSHPHNILLFLINVVVVMIRFGMNCSLFKRSK